MAQTAKKLHNADEARVPGRVVSMRGTSVHSVTTPEQALERLGGERRTTDFLVPTTQSLDKVYRRARARGGVAYQHFSSAARNLARRAQARAAQIKKHQPVQLLAVVTGSAFVLGVIARIWRSRHYA